MRFAVRPARLLAGQLLLIPVAVGYRLGMIPAGVRGRQMAARIGFHGEEATAGAANCGTVLGDGACANRLSIASVSASCQGDDVVVVSASLDVYLGPWCDRQGVDYICTTLEERDGRLTGSYFQGDCSRRKVRRILQRYELARYSIVYAYGDSVEDREMLELAHGVYIAGQKSRAGTRSLLTVIPAHRAAAETQWPAAVSS